MSGHHCSQKQRAYSVNLDMLRSKGKLTFVIGIYIFFILTIVSLIKEQSKVCISISIVILMVLLFLKLYVTLSARLVLGR